MSYKPTVRARIARAYQPTVRGRWLVPPLCWLRFGWYGVRNYHLYGEAAGALHCLEIVLDTALLFGLTVELALR